MRPSLSNQWRRDDSRQADEPWTTENSRPKQKIPTEEADDCQIKWTDTIHELSQPHGDNNQGHTIQLFFSVSDA